MLKSVENLTADELKWLHDNDFLKLFNGCKTADNRSVLSWRIDVEGMGPFASERYKCVMDVDKIQINQDLGMVNYEGWLSVKDLLFKKKLMVRCFGLASSALHMYEVFLQHTDEELYKLMDMITPGKVMKVELMEQKIDDVVEQLVEHGFMGGELKNEE